MVSQASEHCDPLVQEIRELARICETRLCRHPTHWNFRIGSKTNAYEWEYDAIRIGDSYYDGEQQVFKILDKSVQDNPLYDLEKSVASLYPVPRKIITVQAQIKVRPEKAGLYYGVEQELKVGKELYVSTENFYFDEFRIVSID